VSQIAGRAGLALSDIFAIPLEPGLKAENATVEVDTSTLSLSSFGSITGVVFIRSESACFPEEGWNDFAVTILGWWLEPLPRILQKKTRQWDLRFMDGPCTARLTQERGDTWSLASLHNDRQVFKVPVSCLGFITSLIRAARTLLAACEKRGWQTPEMDHLASTVRMLQSQITHHQ
jgi:hypothetical protein